MHVQDEPYQYCFPDSCEHKHGKDCETKCVEQEEVRAFAFP